ncbi:hypothetical protein [Microcoleus phage My-WqHQDG]|nr:hypothetical protein [Microcoleus phage My-WqHQDG]
MVASAGRGDCSNTHPPLLPRGITNISYTKMTNNQVEDRVRMFIVEGLPDKNIPVPAQAVLRTYLEGDSNPMIEYLTEQLSHPYMVGSYWVNVDADIVEDHLHDDCARTKISQQSLLIHTGET